MFYRYDNVITLRTFSKVYGLAGFRVGYGFAHRDLITNLMKVKLPFEPSSCSQVAAIAALDDLAHLEDTILLNRKEMNKVCNKLEKNKLRFIPSSANFVTIIFNSRNEVINSTKFLLKNGIIVRDLIGFGLENCIRVTIGTEYENKLFMKKIEKYINK